MRNFSMFWFRFFAVASKNDCACIVNTYSKLSRLWENKDKQQHLEHQYNSQNTGQSQQLQYQAHQGQNYVGLGPGPGVMGLHTQQLYSLSHDSRDSSGSCSGL